MTPIELPMAEPLRLSNSKAKTYRRCPKQYEFKYVQKLRRKSHALPLKRGDWLHQLMMTHYDGHDWRVRHAELTVEFMKLFEEEREEYGDLPTECSRIFRSYLAHYRHIDGQYTVIDSEVDEIVELPNGDTFNFIIDLIVEDQDGGIWLWDHKTVKGFMPADFMLLDTQLSRYFWAARKIGIKGLRGVMFNELITAPPTAPELLKNGRLTERQNLKCDVYTYMATIKAHGLDPKDYRDTLLRLKGQSDRWFRRTKLPKSKHLTEQMMRELLMTSREIKEATRRGHFPRHPDKSCQWGCDFTELCIIDLNGGDTSDVIKLKYQPIKKDTDSNEVPTPKKGK